jgi:hypothetical protein
MAEPHDTPAQSNDASRVHAHARSSGETSPTPPRLPRIGDLSRQEQKSITHGDFWIPEEEREIYKHALRALNSAGVPYVIAGAYAIYEHTGIYRETKDLDVFCTPEQVVNAARVLRGAGFRARMEQPHWLAKALWDDGRHFIDIIYGMGNGLATIDDDWYRYSRPAILAATPVRVAPPEELLWHRLFISERHRQDMADIVHLIATVGRQMNWDRLLRKTGDHWPLLLSQLLMYEYVYPEAEGNVPERVMNELLSRASALVGRKRNNERVTRGTLISRFSFAIDINEWGFRDVREELTQGAERSPVIREIAASDVWQERSNAAREYDESIA